MKNAQQHKERGPSREENLPLDRVKREWSLLINLCMLLSLVTSVSVAAGERLWDQEPTLWEIAQQTVEEFTIPETDNQSSQTGAYGFGSENMRAALWGAPEKLAVNLRKLDVYDRRYKISSQLPTLNDLWEGYSGAPDENRKKYDHENIMIKGRKIVPAHSLLDRSNVHPKPTGQILLISEALQGARQPVARQNLSSGVIGFHMQHKGAEMDLEYLVSRAGDNIIAIQGSWKGFKEPPKLRLYRHNDTSKSNIEPPVCRSDGELFWIEQKLPAEKTFPDGFHYVMMGLISDPSQKAEVVNGEKDLGLVPPGHNPWLKRASERKEGKWKGLAGFSYDELRKASGSAATVTFNRKVSEFQAFFTVITINESEDPLSEARARLMKAKKLGMKGLTEENSRWYKNLYDKRENGRVFTGHPDHVKKMMPAIFRSWTCKDIRRSKPDPKRYEGDERYASLFADRSRWEGLPCYNELV